MATEASGESFSSEERGAPVRSEPEVETGGDGAPLAAADRETSSGGPDEESSLDSDPVAPQGGTSAPTAQLTPDDDPDGETFEEALEGEDGFSDVSKPPALVANNGVTEGEPPSETRVLAAVEANSQHENLVKVSSDDPNTAESSQYEILAAEEKESVENPTLQSTEEKPIKDEAPAAEGVDGDEEHAVSDAQEEKDGSSVKESGESASPAMERVTESKKEKEGFEAAEEERDGAKADDVDDVKVGIAGSADPNQSVYLVGIPAAEEKESVENSTLQSTKEKSIEDEAALPRGLDGDGDPAVPDGQEENDGNLVQVSGESANPAIQGVVESKTDAAEEERDGAEADSMDEVETGIAGSADSDQYVCPVSISAAHTVDELCKLTNGINKEEENKNLVRSYPNLDTKIADVSLQKLDGSNGKKSTADVGNTEKGDGSSESFEIKNGNSSENSADKVDIVNDGQTVYSMPSIQETGNVTLTIESDRAANQTEANNDEPVLELVPDGDNSISAQDRKSQSITAEESKDRETEEYKFGTSGVTDYVRLPNSVSELEPTLGEDFIDHVQNLDQENAEEEDKSLVSDGPARVAILASSETAKNMIKELEEGSSSTSTYSALDSSKDVDGQIVLDSDEEMATDEEDDGKEMIDSDALVALLRAASGSSTDGGISVTSQDAARIFSFDRPAGLGSAIPSLKPAPPRPARPNLLSPSELAVAAEPDNLLTEEQKKLHEKVELIRVKFLRLVHRLGHSPEETVAAQVLYRLSLAEGIRSGRQTNRTFSLESAKKKALQLEQDGTEGLDFSCNILVLGKSGVGKSATINSIFGEEKSRTDAFEPATSSVKEIVGIVDGVKIRVIDTPGLRASGMDQASSRRILTSIKKYTKRCPPDIVLYVDRMDTMTRDQNDLPLLRTITSTLGSSIWFNAIVALTHAASAPPDGPGGSPLSYEVFVAQRSHAVQQSIRLAAGDMRLMNPVALVENHPSCRRNREGQRVLPNGLTWRPQMLLLCYSSKILSEANSLLKLQDSSPGKLFGFRFRSPPLPFLLSSLLQSRAHPKLPTDQGGENEDSDMDLDDLSDADQEEEDEYDQLPPFKPLKKSQIAKLTKEQRRAYFDEYDYRVKLLQKKQWREELRRLKAMKNRQKVFQDDFGHADTVEDFDQDNSPATVPVPLPDMVLPPSFDCDAPTYRYRFLESTSQFLSRPVMDTHGWDHDCGYDGVSLEESLAVAGRFPAVLSAQVTKDKKEFSIHLDSSISAKHGENGSTLAGFDIQAIGKQLAYILRGETKFKALKKNRTTGGISITFLGETVATGLKLEDQLSIGKQVNLVVSAGAVRAQGDTAYGANLEARLRDKDYPIGQALSTLGLSLMRWHGDLALGTNLQSQFSIGRNSKMAVRVALNNKLAGQITVRTSTSEQLQLALVGIIPIAISIFRSMRPGEFSTN